MSPKLAVILGLVLLVVIGFAFHWWIVDVRRIWDWLVYAEPADLPGPDQGLPARGAGEHHPTADEWEQLDPDEAADVWVAELHDETLPVVRFDDSPWDDPPLYVYEPELSYEERRRVRLEWMDALAWDARQGAARCWEILHVEFPRLRAELCGAAA